MEARRGLRVERHRLSLSGALDPKVFNVCSSQSAELGPPLFGREIQIGRPYQIADSTAFMSFLYTRPGVFELGFQVLRFVGDDESAREQIEYGAIGAGNGSIELPAREHGHSARADCLLDNLFGAGNSFSGKSGMNCAEKVVANGSFGQRQEDRFIHGIRGPLGCRFELADGLNLVAEKLNAHRTVRFGRVDIENAAAQRVFAGHFDHIGGCISDGIEVAQQRISIERVTSPHDASQVRIVLSGAQAQGRRRDRRGNDRNRAGGDLP